MRNKFDYYPTPEWCYEKLPVDWNQFNSALEPGSGDGRIVTFLENKGIETDWCEIQKDKDFFKHEGEYDLVITNPPFSLAQEFIEHAMTMAPTVIMLLRINFLGAQARYDFWQMYPPDGLVILSKRPSFTGKGTDSIDYAWFIWSDIKDLHGLKWIR